MLIVHFPLDMWCDLILTNDKRVTSENTEEGRTHAECMWIIPFDALIRIICSNQLRQQLIEYGT